MAVNDSSDPLARLPNCSGLNNRHVIWLWLGLYVHRGFELDRDTCNGETMRDVVAQVLKVATDIAYELPTKKDQFLLPEEQLEWITTDPRQMQWLTTKIDNLTNRVLPVGFPHLQGRERIVAALDIWLVDLEEKQRGVEQLHDQWRKHIAKDSQFDWFNDKKEGEKRCICAWEWIQKNPLDSVRQPSPIGSYSELLMLFDQAELNSFTQKAVIQEIKKRWNRQQFSERNADKRQVNVMLPNNLIAQIEELANQKGLKQREMIEDLLRKGIEATSSLTASREG